MKRLGLSLIFLLIFCNSVFADVQNNINNGLNWLLTSQNANGSYGSQPEIIFRETFEVLTTFNILNQKGSQYQNSIQWIQNTKVNNIDFIARKIMLLSREGIGASTGINLLPPNQNTDGGWGLAVHGSDTIDTILALIALKSVSYSDQQIIQSALNYLLSTQNSDGGWGFYQGDDSNVYMTALVSATLQQFPQTTSLATTINKATNYLVAHQNADGGFGSSPSTIYETSLAYIALVGVTTDNTILGNAVNYLTSTQSSDGSWLQDPYSTALALRALYLSENKPAPPPPQPPTEITPPVISPSPTDTTVTGRLTDSATGNPITGADVAVVGTNITTKTDSTGAYTLSGITSLEFSLKAAASGYDSKTVNVKTTAFGAYTVDFSLNQSQASDTKITSLITDKQAYPSNSNVAITATLTNSGNIPSDVSVKAKIINQQGTIFDILSYPESQITVDPKISVNISLNWNTAQHHSGTYKIILTVTDFAQGVLLDEKEITFSILPAFTMTNAILSVSPTFTYNGKTETLKLSSTFSYASNVSANVSAAYTLKDPQNNILEQGTVLMNLPAGEDTVYREIAQITRTFTTGQYSLSIVFSKDGTVLRELTGNFGVLSNIRINTERSVTPMTVLPDANGKVKIIIDLKGVEQ